MKLAEKRLTARGVLTLIVFATRYVVVVLAARTRLTWINGVGYSLDTAATEKREISRFFGQKVHFCYNPTSMAHTEDHIGYVGDFVQAGTQKLGRLTTEVDKLVDHLRENLSKLGKNGYLVHIAHSQGALITHLATQRLTIEEMKRIEVLAFGGAAALRKTPETPFRRCINYYSINDPLLFLVPSASQALRSGFVTDDNEFCFLSPRVGDPIIDHYLLSPTYAQALQWEGSRFQRHYQSSMYRSMRIAFLLISSLFEAIDERLREMLKTLIRYVLLWCVSCYLGARGALVFGQVFLSSFVVKPLLLLFSLIHEWIRSLKGGDKYVPVSSIMDKKAGNRHRKN